MWWVASCMLLRGMHTVKTFFNVGKMTGNYLPQNRACRTPRHPQTSILDLRRQAGPTRPYITRTTMQQISWRRFVARHLSSNTSTPQQLAESSSAKDLLSTIIQVL